MVADMGLYAEFTLSRGQPKGGVSREPQPADTG
jgi:hypothetical protein